MDIWHRVAFNTSIKPHFFDAIQRLRLVQKTLQLPGDGGMMVFFDIAESDPRWPVVSELITQYGASDRVETFFSEEEILQAEWVRLIALEQGYPQPQSSWPLKQQSYDLLCTHCGIYRQTRPMRLAKEPGLRKKSFLSLIWTNEVLCTPEVIQSLEGIGAKGYEVWDVLIHKTSQPSERIQQIYIPGVAFPGLVAPAGLKREICPVCGTTKYYPHMRGVMTLKKEALPTGIDFMLTNEWFGSGLIAFREILISNRVARLILERGWQGVRLKVVELV
jgi:hypothetical protein